MRFRVAIRPCPGVNVTPLLDLRRIFPTYDRIVEITFPVEMGV